ncbi:serine/threonine-protein phosphatase 2A 56 kDa regulatory subunit delta isoform [Pestalotiopsis sp. IQ-011]
MGLRPHAPPGRGNAIDNGGDEVFQAMRQIRRSDSGTDSILHHQIRRLHSQLNVRNEHIQNLRRDLDAMYGADVGILSERLRQAKGECRMWRERAENAEKRIAAFERFTTKFKNLKGDVENMANGGGSVANTRNGGSDGVDSPEVYENYISKYLDDAQGGTKHCSLSKAQSELWIAAEKLLGV